MQVLGRMGPLPEVWDGAHFQVVRADLLLVKYTMDPLREVWGRARFQVVGVDLLLVKYALKTIEKLPGKAYDMRKFCWPPCSPDMSGLGKERAYVCGPNWNARETGMLRMLSVRHLFCSISVPITTSLPSSIRQWQRQQSLEMTQKCMVA